VESGGMSRRALLQQGGAVVGGLAVLRLAGPIEAFPSQQGAQVIPWLDQPAPNPVPEIVGQQLVWEDLDSWITPVNKFFTIAHFGPPTVNERDWRLEVGGLVGRPRSYTLAELRARPRREVTFTLECSGNTGLPFFWGGVGNARWAGTPLASLLEEVGVLPSGIEVVFWGADAGEQTWREMKITEQFARSMSLADALDPDNLLCYEMNGAPLDRGHGFPLRLILPGWYGVANVKWLTRIELRDARYQGHFMARDYVTIREEQRDGQTVWTFTSVTHARLKSAPAKVTRMGDRYQIMGAAWGAPIAAVEVKIDNGPWTPATLTMGQDSAFTWAFWTLDWTAATPGEHSITSRAIDTSGQVQPAPESPAIAGKQTYWESNGQITRRVRIP
jgi:DMSO/TMAO reductase YedYZ molybdopterin-dependent catalytic subunit